MTTERVSNFINDYKAGLVKHDGKEWKHRKKLAFAEASERWIPDANMIIQGFLKKTNVNQEARELVTGIASTARAKRREIKMSNKSSKFVSVETNLEKSKPNIITANEMYRKWLETKNFIPSDSTLEYFTGFDKTTLGNIRTQMVSEGWTFERASGYGWNVVSRPVKAVAVSYSDLGEKIIAALAKLSTEDVEKIKVIFSK